MNIKEFFTENKIGKLIFSTGLGALKGVPVAGNIITELRDNKSDDLSGFGKINIPRYISYGLMSVLFIGRIVFPEYINAELLKELMFFVF